MQTRSSDSWGVVATIRAPTSQIAQFCAFHLRAGAERLFIYLDDPDSDAVRLSELHPAISITCCDDDHWRELIGKRPKKHQVRQTLNATHAYGVAAQHVAWLAHIDVDEFITGPTPVHETLATLPDDCFCLRLHPMEPLAGAQGLFKLAPSSGNDRARILHALYPDWADLLQSGLLSHRVGKLLVRTGRANARVRIHNVLFGDDQNPGIAETQALRLAHLHAPDWGSFRAAFDFRLEKGSYRAGLAPNRPREQGGVTLHEVLSQLLESSGEDGLRAFYDQVCTARPELVDRLSEYGLLYHADLQLQDAVTTVFRGKI